MNNTGSSFAANNPPPTLQMKAPLSGINVAPATRSPVNQDMKENMSAALKRQQNNGGNSEDISLLAGANVGDDEFQEHKTPTG